MEAYGKWKVRTPRGGTVEMSEQLPSSPKRNKTTIQTLQKPEWAAERFGTAQIN
jgi:hypothetical protein